MPRAQFGKGEYFHVFNRGVEKRSIYLNDADRWRFLTLLFVSQSDFVINQVNRLVPFVQRWRFDNEIFKEICRTQCMELVSFCLMSNHFHLILREVKDGSISKFMQRLQDAYTKYFNIKYRRSGHLFGGKFQSVHIDRNEYLNYLSAYIHLNPRELKRWSGKEVQYPWSSFQDFVVENRWQSFLDSSVVLGQFKNGKEYQSFVEETPAKQIRDEIGGVYLID